MSLANVISRVRRRAREMWAEAEYGRKRMLEVRTGHVYTEETRRRQNLREIKALEDLYDAES
jgi:hypothetical protein